MGEIAIRQRQLGNHAAGQIRPGVGIVLMGAAALSSSGCGFTHLHHRANAAPADFRGLLWQFDSPTEDIQEVCFSPDGHCVLLCSSYACRVLDTDSGLRVSVFENAGELRRPLEYMLGAITAVPYALCAYRVRFSPEKRSETATAKEQAPPRPGWRQNRMLVCASDSQHAFYLDSSLRLRTWVLKNGRLAFPPQVIEMGASDRVDAISPSGRVFFVEEYETGLRCLRGCRDVWKQEFPAWSLVSFSADGHRAAIAQPDGEIRVIDCADGREEMVTHARAGARAILSPDGNRVFVDEMDREHLPVQSTAARVLDVPSGRAVYEFRVESVGIRGRLVAWSASADLAAYYHKREYPHAGTEEAVLVDLAECKETCRFSLGLGESVKDVSPDGRFVVTGQSDRHIRLYKVLDPERLTAPR